MASQGGLQIELVVAIAALAAIIVDNAGYLISRRFGRTLLERPGLLERRQRVLEIGEPFFERHGPKAVFFGRWTLGLRTWAPWHAGASKMPWRSFAVWNAAGAISWATTIGLVAYLVDNTATSAITTFGLFGLFGLLVVVFAGAGSLLLRRLNQFGTLAEGRSLAPFPGTGGAGLGGLTNCGDAQAGRPPAAWRASTRSATRSRRAGSFCSRT